MNKNIFSAFYSKFKRLNFSPDSREKVDMYKDIEIYLPQIKKMKIFKYLQQKDIELLLTQAEIIHFKRGDRIISQGDLSEYLYIVLSGTVDVFAQSDEDNVFICNIHAGNVFGESAIFMTEERTASVTSAGRSSILRIHRADILYFIKQRTKGGIKILMLIINSLLCKLRSANMEIVLEKQLDLNLENIDPLIQEIMDDR